MAEINNKLNLLWDDNPVDVTQEANFIWNIANKLRGTYMPDKYGDVIIPMTVLRRFECALAKTKDAVVKLYKENPNYPSLKYEKTTGFQFYCKSEYTLKELQKFNIEVIEEEDKVIINNKHIQKPKIILSGKNDHRIVMALSIMLSKFGGEIEGIEAVNKSYPGFFEDLKSLGIEVEYE